MPSEGSGSDGLEVLVIDDASPDGTGRSRTGSPRSFPGCTCCTGSERRASAPHTWPGSGGPSSSAPTSCSRWTATSRTTPRTCPGSSRPQRDADLVLGSRYVEGGGTRNWGLVRRFISRGGSLYAQALLQLGVRDLTGGFKCYRRAVLERIDLDAISSLGYAFQIETTYRTLRAGFRVVEVPITFSTARWAARR